MKTISGHFKGNLQQLNHIKYFEADLHQPVYPTTSHPEDLIKYINGVFGAMLKASIISPEGPTNINIWATGTSGLMSATILAERIFSKFGNNNLYIPYLRKPGERAHSTTTIYSKSVDAFNIFIDDHIDGGTTYVGVSTKKQEFLPGSFDLVIVSNGFENVIGKIIERSHLEPNGDFLASLIPKAIISSSFNLKRVVGMASLADLFEEKLEKIEKPDNDEAVIEVYSQKNSYA